MGEAYRRKGYSVGENQSAGPDEGIDLVMRKGGDLVLVQCKHWRAGKVDVKIVRELYGVMAAIQAPHGVVITSGMFTQDAKNFAVGKPIDLVDGHELLELIGTVQKTPRIEQEKSLAKLCRDAEKSWSSGPPAEERGQVSNSGDAQSFQVVAIQSPSEEWHRMSHRERSVAGEPLPNPDPFWMTSRSILPKVTLWLNFFSCLDHRWVARRRRGG